MAIGTCNSPIPPYIEAMPRILPIAAVMLDLARRFAPAAVLFSAFFALDGNLKWIGLLGIIPLIAAIAAPRCGCGGADPFADSNFRSM